MENIGIENFILIIVAVGYFIFKSLTAKAGSVEILEEYDQSIGEEEVAEDVEVSRQTIVTTPKMDRPKIKFEEPSPVNTPKSVDVMDTKREEVIADDFDLRKAVIMSEILQPKHKELS